MAFKDILLALTTYPGPTPISAVDEAIAFAAAVGARISAIACEVKYRVPGSPLGTAWLDVPAMAAETLAAPESGAFDDATPSATPPIAVASSNVRAGTGNLHRAISGVSA
jgi:hypothetical protein